MFLEISQNSKENTCVRDSFLIKLQARPATLLKKSLWYRCFHVNFAKFLRTPFLHNTSGRLLLLFPHKTAYSSNNSLNAYKNADSNSKFQPVITTRIYVLHKITIALKFMFYINSDLLIPAKKPQVSQNVQSGITAWKPVGS